MSAGVPFDIHEIQQSDDRFRGVQQLARTILNQDRYLTRDYMHAEASHLFAAFNADRPIGFLLMLIQEIGLAEGRPPLIHNGSPMREAYVEAFGVEPGMRRRGIGNALQARAVDVARDAGCYQIRSRSPIASRENYALKLNAGYVVQPSETNDSCYFILKL